MREGDESEDEQRDGDQGERRAVEEAGVPVAVLLHDGPVAVMVMGRGGPVALGYVVVDVTLA